MAPPRKPGSQVPPNLRPHFSHARTASTHSKLPIDQATAGRLYRVRDKDWAWVWGENLPWADADKLKEQVVTSRKSTTARVEDMEVPAPDWYVAPELPATEPSGSTWYAGVDVVVPAPGSSFELVSGDPQAIPAPGVVTRIPAGHELLVNGAQRTVPAMVAQGDVVQARPLDPYLVRVQASALAQVRPVAAAAQSRSQARANRPTYRDITVKEPAARAAPPPRDKTVSKAPPFVRLGAPPSSPPSPPLSPLKVATDLDGEPLGDDALTDADLGELTGDVGGGPSEDDIALAQRQREADERSRVG